MRSLCDKIEDYMRSPLQIDAEKTLLKKLSIGDEKSPHHIIDIIQELLLFLAAGHLPTWRDLGFSSLVKD